MTYLMSLCKWQAEQRLGRIAKKIDFTKGYKGQVTAEEHDETLHQGTSHREEENMKNTKYDRVEKLKFKFEHENIGKVITSAYYFKDCHWFVGIYR